MNSPSRTASNTSTFTRKTSSTSTSALSSGPAKAATKAPVRPDFYTTPSQYHPPEEPVKHVDSKEDEWHNVELNSHLSVHAWRHKLHHEKTKKPKSADGIKVTGMKWVASALRV